MSTVNLYDVLNLSQDCTRKEIKESYRCLVREFHPDRPGGDPEMFELVTHAFNVLYNPKTRAEYDHVFAMSKSSKSSHYELKKQADEFFKNQETDSLKKPKKEQEVTFKKAFEELDRKHRIDRTDGAKKMDNKHLTERVRDLKLARENEDIETIHEKIFDEGRFDVTRFNAAFDAMYGGHYELIPHTGNPTPWNSSTGNENFSTLENYEELYVEDDKNATYVYGAANFDAGMKKKLTKEEVDKLSSASYYQNHNKKEEAYSKKVDDLLSERTKQSRDFDERKFGDYESDPSCGGYGFLHEVMGANVSQLTWDNKDSLEKRYEKLLELRRQN